MNLFAITIIVIFAALAVGAIALLFIVRSGERRPRERTVRERPVKERAIKERRLWKKRLPPEKQAGNKGEVIAINVIKEMLKGGDILFCNLPISYEGRETELDNVVVNKNGVFIIEIKNYNGKLSGKANDFEWKKTKITTAGHRYSLYVKNPIRQVRRQTYILAQYLKSRGIRVWVEGYALLLRGNSPVRSSCILSSKRQIDECLHKQRKTQLSREDIASIMSALKEL